MKKIEEYFVQIVQIFCDTWISHERIKKNKDEVNKARFKLQHLFINYMMCVSKTMYFKLYSIVSF